MQWLSREELRRLLSAARAYRERDWLMILVAYWHGLRASEVTGLTASCVRDRHLTVQRLKGSLKTTQPLIEHPDALLSEVPALFDFARGMHLNQRLFPVRRETFWRIMQRHARTAGVPLRKAHPHALKHTIAHETIQPAGLHVTSRWLGHKDLSSTAHYLRVGDEEAAQAVAAALVPRV